MAFSITHIKGSNIEVTEALRNLAEQKFSGLAKFIGDESDMTCDVEFEKITNSQSGDIFRAEVNLYLRGKLYRAEATTDQIEKSIDQVQDELAKELRRTQKKMRTLMRKGGAAIKRLVRFGR